MARLSFRQGIARHGKSPQQVFFLQQNSQFVNLVVSPEPSIIAFADGTKDYLFTEAVSVPNAWGPFPFPAQVNWLYWQLDRITGVRTFGSTSLPPIYSATTPVSPTLGQMWFDISTGNPTSNQMFEYNGSTFVQVLRVFASRYLNNQFLSPVDGVSLETNFEGTQIGATGNVTTNIGALAFDASGNPIVNQDSKFFTTEDVFTTGIPSGASLKINNILLSAQAVQSIASYQVVVFTGYNSIAPATSFDFLNKVYGIVEEDIVTNDISNVILEGIIFNEAWDFDDSIGNPNLSGVINAPIYVTPTGDLTTNIVLTLSGQNKVGAIIGRQSILFKPGIFSTSGVIAAGSDKVDVAGDTMTGVLILSADPINALDAATKQYVDATTGGAVDHGVLIGLADDDHAQYYNETRGDSRYYTQTAANSLLDAKVDVAGDTMTGVLILSADPINALDAATKQYVDASPGGYIPLSLNTQPGTNYQLVLADGGNAVVMTSALPNTLSVPLDATEAFPIGTEIVIEQNGVGTTVITPIAGVTINSASGFLALAVQYTAVSLIKKATNIWLAVGDMV